MTLYANCLRHLLAQQLQALATSRETVQNWIWIGRFAQQISLSEVLNCLCESRYLGLFILLCDMSQHTGISIDNQKQCRRQVYHNYTWLQPICIGRLGLRLMWISTCNCFSSSCVIMSPESHVVTGRNPKLKNRASRRMPCGTAP